MLVKNIFIELRSRLRSCNVYIITNVDFKKECNLKISIKSDCIVLNYYNDKIRRDSLSSIESLSESEDETDTCVIPIQDFCNIIPNSLSCLKIIKNTISFRILTEPKNGGNFYSEFLEPPTENNIKFDKLKINIRVQDEIKLQCANCSNIISQNVKFDRILELPSANLDMSEWFCHGHGHGHNHGHSGQNGHSSDMLKPNKLDFLYRLTYFNMNKDLLSEKTNKFNAKREIYHCNRCLAWLGLKNKEIIKFYNSDIKVVCNNISKHVFSHTTTQDLSINDFIYTIETLTKEFNLGLQYTMMCKIILECVISPTVKKFLLIWVMDKELQVLRNCENNSNLQIVNLKSNLLTKLLFKIEDDLNDEVESWLADPNVVTSEISKTMFCNGIKHLEDMSQNIPETFRFSNGYCISYLKA